MKPTKNEFLNDPRRAVTLMGMSGVGKSYLSGKLSSWGWEYYSCDYEIGTRYLGDVIVDTLSAQRGEPVENTLCEADLSLLSEFVGQLGNPDQYGLGLEEFKRRQKLYYDAEAESLRVAAEKARQAGGPIVIDSTGSLCEIEDEDIHASLGEQTLFVYIKANDAEEAAVLRRAQDYPKPLFFPTALFDAKLAQYMRQEGLERVDQIDPNGFSRWVFPYLFEARLPKYERLAGLYGVTIPSDAFKNVSSERQFLAIVADAL